MANDLADVLDEIQTEIGSITGIRKAPQYPPEKMSVFPFAVAYPGGGRVGSETMGAVKFLHNIIIEIHLARKMLDQTVEDAVVYVDDVPEELFGAIFSGAYTTIQTHGDITYEFVPMEWAGVETLGIRFTIENLKIRKAI